MFEKLFVKTSDLVFHTIAPYAVERTIPPALLRGERWMSEERGLSRGTLKNRRWHVGRFLDWLHERQAPVPDLSPRDLDGYLQHLHAKRLSRVSIKIHTNAVRAFIRHAERRGWCTAGLADTLHGPHICHDHGLPSGPSWDDVTRLIQDAASITRWTSGTVRFSCCSPSMASGPVRSPRCALRTSVGSTTV